MSQEKVLDIGLIFDVLKNYKYGTKTEVFEKGAFTGVEFNRSNEAVVQTPEEFDKTKIGCSLDHTLYWVTRAKEVGLSGCGIALVSTVYNKKDDKLEKVFLAMHALPVLQFEGKFIYPETSLVNGKIVETPNARAILQYAKNVWEPMAVENAEKQNIKIDKIEVWFYDPTNYAFIGVDIDQFYKNLQEKGQLFEVYIPRNEPTEPIGILRESVAKHQQNILENFFKTKRKLKEARATKNYKDIEANLDKHGAQMAFKKQFGSQDVVFSADGAKFIFEKFKVELHLEGNSYYITVTNKANLRLAERWVGYNSNELLQDISDCFQTLVEEYGL